jgi:hypothetical protein
MDPSVCWYFILPSTIIFAFIFFFESKIFVPGFIIPSSTNEPKGILGLDLLLLSVSNNSLSIGFVFFILCSAALKYFLSFSIPK